MGVRPQSIDATIDSDDDEDNIIEYGVNEIIINYSSIEQTTSIIEKKLLKVIHKMLFGYIYQMMYLMIKSVE
jgi:fido (protein-threonine AMPylation protein)